jgi:hypothetical protein
MKKYLPWVIGAGAIIAYFLYQQAKAAPVSSAVYNPIGSTGGGGSQDATTLYADFPGSVVGSTGHVTHPVTAVEARNIFTKYPTLTTITDVVGQHYTQNV